MAEMRRVAVLRVLWDAKLDEAGTYHERLLPFFGIIVVQFFQNAIEEFLCVCRLRLQIFRFEAGDLFLQMSEFTLRILLDDRLIVRRRQVWCIETPRRWTRAAGLRLHIHHITTCSSHNESAT